MLCRKKFEPENPWQVIVPTFKKCGRDKILFSAVYSFFNKQKNFARRQKTLRGQNVHLCIASGFGNRPRSDLSRNPQHSYFSLVFFAVLDSTNKYLKDCTAQNRFKNRQVCGIRNRLRGIQNPLWNPQTNNKTCV